MTEPRTNGTDLLELPFDNSCEVQHISEQLQTILHALYIETNTNF